jgi:hypothetical protein
VVEVFDPNIVESYTPPDGSDPDSVPRGVVVSRGNATPRSLSDHSTMFVRLDEED